MKKATLRSVPPSAATEAAYRRRLLRLIEEMQRSIEYWVQAAYRANEPRLAQDETPAQIQGGLIRKLTRRWQRRFNDLARDLAAWFATDISDRVDFTLQSALKRSGFAVEFKLTPVQRDVLHAIVRQNVSLIRSIPQQYMGRVEQIVLDSVRTGRDLGTLTTQLREQFGVAKRRASLIARDQNNKATSALVRVRHLELGIKRGVWMHSHAGRRPRPSHQANDRKEFDLIEGWYDPHEKRKILPGEAINCRCTWRPVLESIVPSEERPGLLAAAKDPGKLTVQRMEAHGH